MDFRPSISQWLSFVMNSIFNCLPQVLNLVQNKNFLWLFKFFYPVTVNFHIIDYTERLTIGLRERMFFNQWIINVLSHLAICTDRCDALCVILKIRLTANDAGI